MEAGLPNAIHQSAASNENYSTHPRPKKRRRRHLIPEPQPPPDVAEILPSDVVSGLLNRSIAMVLKSVGFTGAVGCAQEELLQMTEEYYVHMMRSIARFAQAHRRTRPTVNDIEDLLPELRITPNDLHNEAKRLLTARKAEYPLPPPTPPPEPEPDLSELLGPELDGSKDTRGRLYKHLPPFPSKHTYTSTPLFTERPTEPRQIREKATHEARLAEQALRKLLAMSVTKKDGKKASEKETEGAQVDKRRQKRDLEWEKAFEELSGEPKANGIDTQAFAEVSTNTEAPGVGQKPVLGDEGFLEVIVNSDSQYWRKSKASGRQYRRAAGTV